MALIESRQRAAALAVLALASMLVVTQHTRAVLPVPRRRLGTQTAIEGIYKAAFSPKAMIGKMTQTNELTYPAYHNRSNELYGLLVEAAAARTAPKAQYQSAVAAAASMVRSTSWRHENLAVVLHCGAKG